MLNKLKKTYLKRGLIGMSSAITSAFLFGTVFITPILAMEKDDYNKSGSVRIPATTFTMLSNDEVSNEILTHIFTFLDGKKLGAMALVCKHWKDVSEIDILWKSFGFKSKKEYGTLRNLINSHFSSIQHTYTKFGPDPLLRWSWCFKLADGQEKFLKELLFWGIKEISHKSCEVKPFELILLSNNLLKEVFEKKFANKPLYQSSPKFAALYKEGMVYQSELPDENAPAPDPLILINNVNSPDNEIKDFLTSFMENYNAQVEKARIEIRGTDSEE